MMGLTGLGKSEEAVREEIRQLLDLNVLNAEDCSIGKSDGNFLLVTLRREVLPESLRSLCPDHHKPELGVFVVVSDPNWVSLEAERPESLQPFFADLLD